MSRTGGGAAADVDAAEGDAGLGSFGGSGADSGGLLVRIAPPAPTVCQGQCVDLVPAVTGGVPPYAYMWSQGTAKRGGTLTVCPDATTTYEITVSQTPLGGGDVPGLTRNASTSVTVTVIGACGDADATIVDAAIAADVGGQDDGVADAGTEAGAESDGALDSDAGHCVGGATTPWTGCEQLSVADYPAACPEQASSTWNMCPSKALLAGQPYRFTVTFDVTGAIGTAFEAKIWGTTSDCADGISTGQLLFSQPWPNQSPFTGTVTLQSCVTPDATYPELVFQQAIGANSGIHTFSNLSPATVQICAGCGGDP